jgi:cell volume regulation protein A
MNGFAHPTLFSLAAADEPMATALLVSVFGALVVFSVIFSRFVSRLGVPVVLLFLILGLIGGAEGVGKLVFEDYHLAVRLGTMALVLILFDGGMNTSVAELRRGIVPAGLLATVGVVLTAGLVGLFAHAVGLPWAIAFLLGAIVSCTDAAAVFSVLRGGGLKLKERVGATVEVESCVNDPVAVVLTTAMIEFITADRPSAMSLLEIPVELVVGVVMGLAFGWLGRLLLQRVRLTTAGLYPALTLSLAFISFGATTLAHGSGFLAVFATAVVLGNGTLPQRGALARVHDALAWLGQISMFLMLGLLALPSRLLPVAGIGLAVALFLALVARPLAALACLLPLRFPPAEIGYVGWVGLRGAVPIVLATFPVLAKVQGADRVFNIVFFVVLVSSLVPGATVRWVTRRLKLDVPERPAPSAVLEVNASHPLDGELVSFLIEPSVAVCGAKLSEVEIPPDAAVAMIVRGRHLVAARGETVLQPNDHAYVFFRPADRPYIELLFGRPEADA